VEARLRTDTRQQNESHDQQQDARRFGHDDLGRCATAHAVARCEDAAHVVEVAADRADPGASSLVAVERAAAGVQNAVDRHVAGTVLVHGVSVQVECVVESQAAVRRHGKIRVVVQVDHRLELVVALHDDDARVAAGHVKIHRSRAGHGVGIRAVECGRADRHGCVRRDRPAGGNDIAERYRLAHSTRHLLILPVAGDGPIAGGVHAPGSQGGRIEKPRHIVLLCQMGPHLVQLVIRQGTTVDGHFGQVAG